MNFSLPHSSHTTKDTHELENADGLGNTGNDC